MNLVDGLSAAGAAGAGVLEGGFAVRLTQALVHFVWQGAVIGAAAAGAGWALRDRSARLRYGLSVVALVLMLACLPVTFAVVPGPAAGSAEHVAGGTAVVEAVPVAAAPGIEEPMLLRGVEPIPAAVSTGGAESPPVAGETGPVSVAGADGVAIRAAAEGPPSGRVAALAVRIAPYAASAYVLGVVLMLLRLAVAVWGGHRLWRSASPVADGHLLAVLERQARRVGMRAAPAVGWCARVSVPVVVGILRPVILLPGSLATGLSASQLEALLTHELAHIRRYDLVVNLVQRLVEAVLFFHPAVWYVSRRISDEREHCCDDSVLDSGCARLTYAEAMVRMAELCTGRGAAVSGNAAVLGAAGAGAAGGRPSQFKRRVLRILGGESGPSLRPGRGALAATLLLPAVLLLGLAVIQLRAGSQAAEAVAAESGGEADEGRRVVLARQGAAEGPEEDGGEGQADETVRATVDVRKPGRGRDADPPARGGPQARVEAGLRAAGEGEAADPAPAAGAAAENAARRRAAPVDKSEGWEIHAVFHPAHRQGIWDVAFSPDGKVVASAADDNTVKLWEVSSRRLLRTIERPVAGKQVAFSPDGSKLAIAGGDSGRDPPGELVVWDLEAERLALVLEPHETSKYVRTVAFSPDGRWIAAGGTSTDVTVWDAATGRLRQRLEGHEKLVHQVAFSPDGRSLASASFDRTVKLWDVETGRLSATLTGHEADVRAAVFSPDGRRLVTAGEDRTARVWDLATGRQTAVMEGHRGWVLAAACHPDGTHAATAGGSNDQRVMIWDLATGSWRDFTPFPRQSSPISSVAFSADGEYIAIAGGWNSFEVWRRVGGEAAGGAGEPGRDERDGRADPNAADLRDQLERIRSLEAAADAEAEDSAERLELLRRAAAGYADFHRRHRSTLAGLYARMSQGRCLQKLGHREEALVIYEEVGGAAARLTETPAIERFKAELKELHAEDVRAAEAPRWGDLVLRITYAGKRPEAGRIAVTRDQAVFGPELEDQSLLVGEDGGLANVLAYLTSGEAPVHPEALKAAEREAELTVRDGHFRPRVLPLMAGQPLRLSNSSPVAMNFHVQWQRNPARNQAVLANSGFVHRVERAETLPATVRSDFHPWMRSYLLPLAHPYAAVSNREGSLRIRQLPVSEWTFQIWHEKVGFLKPVGAARREFTFDIGPGVNAFEIRVDSELSVQAMRRVPGGEDSAESAASDGENPGR